MRHANRQRLPRPEPETPGGRPDDEHWLRHCHGFRVDAPDGRLGLVEDVLYGAEVGRPAALAVRGGLLGRRLELVPVEDVDEVDPRRKRLRLRPGSSR